MNKKDYKLAYEYILGVLELGGDMKWPLTIDGMNIFKELVDEKLNKPTLDECIKKWEEKGFEIISHTKERFEVYKQWIEKINHCSHHTSAKVVIEKDYFYIVGQFSNEYTQLLTKTLKALEAENDK